MACACNPSYSPEAGEWLEPRRRSLQWAEIAPLDSILDYKSETPFWKKEKQKKKKRNEIMSIKPPACKKANYHNPAGRGGSRV